MSGAAAGADRLSRALAGLAGRPCLLVALDFDGSLAPIVEDPGAAEPLPEAARALQRLAEDPGVQLALLSGRSLADLRRLARPPQGTTLIGSHGAQVHLHGDDDEGLELLDPERRELLSGLADALDGVVAEHPGTAVELKPTGVVLHTRRAHREVAHRAARSVLDGPASWSGVHVTEGKEVVELSVVETTKGSALTALRERLDLPAAGGGVLFAGDDVTDERAFAVLDDEMGDVTIKVGEGETRARHRVPGPRELAAVLTELADLRSSASG